MLNVKMNERKRAFSKKHGLDDVKNGAASVLQSKIPDQTFPSDFELLQRHEFGIINPAYG
jgi:hypothetical protein